MDLYLVENGEGGKKMLSMIIREEIRKTYSNSVKITINMKQENAI